MSEYVSINTKEIDRCLELLRIKNVRLQCKLSEYDQIVAAISQNWKGQTRNA